MTPSAAPGEQEDGELRRAAQPHPLDVVFDVLGHASIVPPSGRRRATRAGQGRSGSRSETSARMPEARMRPAAAASAHCSSPSREGDPGRGVGLDDVRRGAAGVPGTLDDLHRAERRHAHLDAVPRRLLGEQLQQVAHGGREIRAGGQRMPRALPHAASAARPSSVVILRGMAPRYAVSQAQSWSLRVPVVRDRCPRRAIRTSRDRLSCDTRRVATEPLGRLAG